MPILIFNYKRFSRKDFIQKLINTVENKTKMFYTFFLIVMQIRIKWIKYPQPFIILKLNLLLSFVVVIILISE